MERDIIVIHSSDLHLDADPSPGDANSDNLEAVLGVARRTDAELVLLAGDTFDSHRQPREFVRGIAARIAAASIEVVLLPGNHDPIVPDGVYEHLMGIDNLHILGVTCDEAVIFDELEIEVWGRPHRGYGDMQPFERARERRTRWQIAMGHGHYDPVPDHEARFKASWLIGDAQLAATRADYIALGHWNRATQVGANGIAAHYSGSPDYAGSVNRVCLSPDGRVRAECEVIRERRETAPPPAYIAK